jgi:hypothetical protein
MSEGFEWAAVSAIASSIAATIALGSSLVALRVARTHARLAEFNNCLEILKQLSEAERKAATAADEEQQSHEIKALLNLFEVLALMVNRKQVGAAGVYLISGYLVETWVWLQTTEGLAAIVDGAITGPTTFAQLQTFRDAHRARIDAQVSLRGVQ